MSRFPMMVPFGIRPTPDTDDDFHQVPSTDRGNAVYTDRGQLGGFAPSNKPYPAPDDVKFESGFGCTEDDGRRGWLVPGMDQSPAYDLDNYKSRSTLPKVDDTEANEGWVDRDDMEFRARGMRSRGFLTRER